VYYLYLTYGILFFYWSVITPR